ncbi:MAG: DUF4912 domain-containing protein [Planctomycetes bacterium]|nr:DUF4912 domain-containing protein [Planctomycetota bacterium]
MPTAMISTGERALFRTASGNGRSRMVAPAPDLARHFRDHFPILLDGAQPQRSDQRHFIRQARDSLVRGRTDPDCLPAAVLRETLAAVTAADRGETMAGLTAIGPRNARIWWESAVVDSLGDILAGLDRPRPVLRFFDVTGLDPDADRWHKTFDIDVDLQANGRTVDFPAPDRQYVVDLGYLHADGRFLRLARTNTIHLPRDGRGRTAGSETARSRLPQDLPGSDALLAPDASAREWLDARDDHPERDAEAELLVHMLYRGFLREGPRALRRAPPPRRRDSEELHREFARRERLRQRRASRGVGHPAPLFLVARLDQKAAREAGTDPILRPPAVIADPRRALSPAGDRLWRCVRLVAGAVDLARRHQGKLPVCGDGVKTPAAPTPLVQSVADDTEPVLVARAIPVFAAARELRHQLTPAIPPSRRPEPADRNESVREFGGAEARRFAKSGVRIDRMALTLEGRMRPNARLKVAGKLVHADADGRFRLECVLSGRRARIPLRAGSSVQGEVRSLLRVEWEKRAGRERVTATS